MYSITNYSDKIFIKKTNDRILILGMPPLLFIGMILLAIFIQIVLGFKFGVIVLCIAPFTFGIPFYISTMLYQKEKEGNDYPFRALILEKLYLKKDVVFQDDNNFMQFIIKDENSLK